MEEWIHPERTIDDVGRCCHCGRTFVDVPDLQGELLPGNSPLRLTQYRQGAETTLGEWCSGECFQRDIGHHPWAATTRVSSTQPGVPSGDTR